MTTMFDPENQLLQIALPTPLYRLFDYLCPQNCLANIKNTSTDTLIGRRVQVPFGRQTLIGMILRYVDKDKSDIDSQKLKNILQIIDKKPIFNKTQLDFAKWLASYYHYPLGETLAVMLPSLLLQGESIEKTTKIWHISAEASDDNFVQKKIKKTAKKQWSDFLIIKNHPNSDKQRLKNLGVSTRNLTLFQNTGLIVEDILTDVKINPPKLNQPALELNSEQQIAVNAIHKALDNHQYQGFLLDGITGSGKTEVYLQVIDKTIKMGKQALILVPEIGLTPQSQVRFSERFCANIVVLHSKLNDKQRLDGWIDCQNGQAQIIIATRSSLFYPFANLGLIIIDEAHDASFKQQDHLRYHACDAALYLGYIKKIPVVLGTATPSLESIKLVQDGKLTELKLTQRAGNAKPPTLELIDMRRGVMDYTNVLGEFHHSHFAIKTIDLIRQTLKKGQQVLIFLNRRGFAPILLCQACGWQANCPNCSSHLTLHKNHLKKPAHINSSYLYDYLKCHHCGYQIITPKICPDCQSRNLADLGQGTTQLYEELHALFANPQATDTIYPIIQIDKDTMSRKSSWYELGKKINTGDPMILIGTQMIAKGHHFHQVTLVVVANADQGFLSPNFRSPEHTAQLILQVAGRAGRADLPGRVLVQTYQPNNPLLLDLIKQGYHKFAHDLLIERKQLPLPPFCHAAIICASSTKKELANAAIMGAKNTLPQNDELMVLAPIPAAVTKKNNRYYIQLLILAKNRHYLHEILSQYWYQMPYLPTSKNVKLTIDIDPIGW